MLMKLVSLNNVSLLLFSASRRKLISKAFPAIFIAIAIDELYKHWEFTQSLHLFLVVSFGVRGVGCFVLCSAGFLSTPDIQREEPYLNVSS